MKIESVKKVNIAKRLAELRTYRGYTQQRIANRLKINLGTYGTYETGRAEPSIHILLLLADIYCITMNELLGTGNSPEKLNDLAKKYQAASDERQRIVDFVLGD